MDQARLIYDAAIGYIHSNRLLEALVKRERESPFPTVTFKNGSVITVRSTARGGVYIRGKKFDVVRVDEGDYVGEEIINESVRMTLADVGGELRLTSTPKAKRGLVYRTLKAAREGDPRIYGQTGSTFENPHVDHEYIRALRPQMTKAAWQREIEGNYTDDEGAYFRWEDIQALYEPAGWALPEEPVDGRRYVLGADVAKKLDWTVLTVLDVTTKPWRGVYWERFNRQRWPVVADRIRRVHQQYDCHKTVIDATGVGEAVLDLTSDFADGFVFTGRSKPALLSDLQVELEQRGIQIPFVRELVDELQNYEENDDDLITDSVMSLALACHAAGPRSTVEFVEGIF